MTDADDWINSLVEESQRPIDETAFADIELSPPESVIPPRDLPQLPPRNLGRYQLPEIRAEIAEVPRFTNFGRPVEFSAPFGPPRSLDSGAVEARSGIMTNQIRWTGDALQPIFPPRSEMSGVPQIERETQILDQISTSAGAQFRELAGPGFRPTSDPMKELPLPDFNRAVSSEGEGLPDIFRPERRAGSSESELSSLASTGFRPIDMGASVQLADEILSRISLGPREMGSVNPQAESSGIDAFRVPQSGGVQSRDLPPTGFRLSDQISTAAGVQFRELAPPSIRFSEPASAPADVQSPRVARSSSNLEGLLRDRGLDLSKVVDDLSLLNSRRDLLDNFETALRDGTAWLNTIGEE